MIDDLNKKVCINGNNKHLLNKDTFDDLVDIWHESNSILELHDFLGLSFSEYLKYVNTNTL